MPEISIIVPVYKVEKYLERCIKSILTQTFIDLELILVDDGSPDQCGEICDIWSLKDKRVRVIHQENKGVSAARNIGIKYAHGKYIGFVDGDDWIEKDMFSILYNLILERKADIAECRFREVNDVCEIMQPDFDITELSGENKIIALYSADYYGSIVVWNKLFKKELFQKVMFLEGKRNEDQIITPQLFWKANKVVSINYIGYFYFRHAESIMHSEFDERKLDAVDAYRMTREFLIKNELFRALDYHDATYAFLLVKYMNLLKKNHIGRNKFDSMRKELQGLFLKFINNPVLNAKSKLILILKCFKCLLY